MQTRRRKLIREKVESLLSDLSITKPKVSVEKIARHYGIAITTEHVDGDISGFLARHIEHGKAIIGVNENQSSKRRRFTIAHELGHYFLHSDQGHNEVHVDRSSRFVVKLRDSSSSRGENEDEKEANLFAAELLMPASFLADDVSRYGGFDLIGDDDEVVAELAEKYDVSTQAMSYRLAYLAWNAPVD